MAAEADVEHFTRLDEDVEAIRALLTAKLPQDFETQRLFDVDLLDEQAIAARTTVLQAHIAASTARRGRLRAELPPPPDQEQALARLDLEIERDRLRLAFLQRTPAERATVIDAERKRRHIGAEEEAAKTAGAQAAETERRAQAARDAALDDVQSAWTAAAKDLANERARAEAARASVAALKGQLAEQRQLDAKLAGERLEREHAFAQKVAAPAITPAAADVLYDAVVSALEAERAELGRALDEIAAPSQVGSFKPGLQLDATEFANAPRERETLNSVIEQVRIDASDVAAEEYATRQARAAALAGEVTRLNNLRLHLLGRLSAAKRRAVLSFTGEGLAQLHREVTHLRLMARWYPYQLTAGLRALPQRLRRLSILAAMKPTLLSVLVLLAISVVVRSRYHGWLKAVRGLMLGRVTNPTLDVVVDRWLRALAAVAPAFGFLLVVLLLFQLLDQSTMPNGITVVESLALAFAWYRFGVAAVHHFIISALMTARVEVPTIRTRRIRQSVILVGRYIFAVAVILIVSSYLLGRGYLFHLVLELAWIGGLPIAFRLTRHWQRDIASAYLLQHPQGRFADLMRRNAGATVGVLAAAVALIPVAGTGFTKYLRATALRFEQTRRALAFLFRRRLERHADVVRTGAVDESALPEVLRQSCGDGPPAANLAVEHYPHLEDVRSLIRNWTGASPGAALAIVGERGIGKTSWLQQVQVRVTQVTVGSISLEDRITSPERVHELAARLLGVSVDLNTDAIVEAAQVMQPRLLILDNCQNLYLRTVDGGRGYQTLMDIIGRTCGRHLWLCAFSRYMWDHLTSVYRGQSFFRRKIVLDAWDEASIGQLIDRRMAAAGFSASYQDLMVRHVDGTSFDNEVIRTSESYRRLLWDYADGNPRVALHFWLRSLVANGPQHVRVRLFEAPSADDLEALQEEARFVLGAVVLHQSLTVSEAARVLRYSPALCESLLEFLLGQGYLVNEGGHFFISTQWYRATIRFLKRKHLVLA